MKVAVCGDSWFSTDLKLPGQSFGQVLCETNQWQLIDLARGGCTNFAISLQVDRAIEMKADFVLLGTTTSDRLDIPFIRKKQSFWEKFSEKFDWSSWSSNIDDWKAYTKSKGLGNINFVHHRNNGSAYNKGLEDHTVISETINNFLREDLWHGETKEQKQAVKNYVTYLHDNSLKKQIDCWIISDACRRLQRANIKFLLFAEFLFQYEFVNDIEWIGQDHLFSVQDLSFWNLDIIPGTREPEFHYDPTQSVKIAEIIRKKMQAQLEI